MYMCVPRRFFRLVLLLTLSPKAFRDVIKFAHSTITRTLHSYHSTFDFCLHIFDLEGVFSREFRVLHTLSYYLTRFPFVVYYL